MRTTGLIVSLVLTLLGVGCATADNTNNANANANAARATSPLPTPTATASPANAQKMISVPSTGYSPFGSEGSHSVETGCVCAHSRSRSYTNRSREYSEFS